MAIGFCFVRNCCNDCQLIFLQYPISITVCDIVIKLIASHRCIILQSNKPKENHMTKLDVAALFALHALMLWLAVYIVN